MIAFADIWHPYQKRCPQRLITASFDVSRQMLHSKVLSWPLLSPVVLPVLELEVVSAPVEPEVWGPALAISVTFGGPVSGTVKRMDCYTRIKVQSRGKTMTTWIEPNTHLAWRVAQQTQICPLYVSINLTNSLSDRCEVSNLYVKGIVCHWCHLIGYIRCEALTERLNNFPRIPRSPRPRRLLNLW